MQHAVDGVDLVLLGIVRGEVGVASVLAGLEPDDLCVELVGLSGEVAEVVAGVDQINIGLATITQWTTATFQRCDVDPGVTQVRLNVSS